MATADRTSLSLPKARKLFGETASRAKKTLAVELERLKDKRRPEAVDPADSAAAVGRALRYSRPMGIVNLDPLKIEARRALGALERATLTIDAIREPLNEARDVVATATATEDQQAADLLAQQYDQILDLIDSTIAAATHDDLNLVDGSHKTVEVALETRSKTRLVIQAANLTTAEDGIGLPYSTEVFSSPSALRKLAQDIDAAIARLSWLSRLYCMNAAMLVDHYKTLVARETVGGRPKG